MPDIFADTQVPAWLQRIAQPTNMDLAAKDIGMALGGGLLSLTEQQPVTDESGAPVRDDQGNVVTKGTSLKQGLTEARLNQIDPTWKLKVAQQQNQILGQIAQNESNWMKLKSQREDLDLWRTRDLPAIAKFQSDLKVNPDAVPPVVESSQGLQVMGQLEKMQLAIQKQQLAKDNAKTVLENQKTSQAFDQAVASAPPTIGAAIDELPNQGWNVDRQGRKTTPSTRALQIYDDWAKSEGKAPFGTPAAVQTQIERGKEQAALQETKGKEQEKQIGMRGEEARKTEQQKFEHRQIIAKAVAESKIDLEKLKQSLKVGVGGKTISRDEFINRHFNTVFNSLKNNPGLRQEAARSKIPFEMLQVEATKDLLDEAYDSGTKAAPGKAVAPPPAKPAAQASVDDPLGILK